MNIHVRIMIILMNLEDEEVYLFISEYMTSYT